MFRGSSTPSSTSPPSHRRIFTKSSTHDFPHREPPLRIWLIQVGVHNSSLKQQQPLHKRQDTTTITSTLRGIGTQPNNNHLTLEGYDTKSNNHSHLYTQRDSHKPNCTTSSTLRGKGTKPQAKERVTTLGGLNKPQTNFLTK